MFKPIKHMRGWRIATSSSYQRKRDINTVKRESLRTDLEKGRSPFQVEPSCRRVRPMEVVKVKGRAGSHWMTWRVDKWQPEQAVSALGTEQS